MSDRVTGFGQTIDEYEMMNGSVSVSDVYNEIYAREDGATRLICPAEELSINDGSLMHGDDVVSSYMNNDEYAKLCGILNIPTAYLLRLPASLRKANIEYWLGMLGEKEISILCKDGELLEVGDGDEIRRIDLFKMLADTHPNAIVFRVVNQVNATMFDIYDGDYIYDTEYDTYFGGIRLVHKKGLNAPDISPIFINVNSCGIIECAEYLDKMAIQHFGYKDILQMIRERFSTCFDALPQLFHVFESIAAHDVPNPHRRIALYCREHNVPERVRSYALSSFDESGLQRADYEVLIDLFSSLGYANEVKQSSERKLQQLAGYIIVKARGEHRCDKCDSQINND